MPLYEYECEACGQRVERIQSFSDPPLAECPVCSGPVRKLMSMPAIQFKGSGWYITDYARKGQKADKGETGTDKGSEKGEKSVETAKSAGSLDRAKSSPASDSPSSSSPANASTGSSSSDS